MFGSKSPLNVGISGLLFGGWLGLLSGCAPAPPSGLEEPTDPGSVQANLSVTVMWDAPTTDAAGDELDDLAGYFLYVGTVSPLTRSNSTRIDAGLATSFEVDRLDRLVYYFAVSAVDLAGNESELSEQLAADLTTPASASVGAILATAGNLSVAIASAVTGAAGSVASLADDAVPPAPEKLSATAVSPEQIDLIWSRPAGFPPGQVSEYRVYRDDVQVGTASDTTFQDGGLEPDTEYEYYVTAVDKGDGLEGPASNKVKERTLPPPDVTPPTAPSDLTASPGGPDKIELSWTAADDPESGVASYNIYRDGAQVGSTAATSFSDTGLDPSTLYSYEVSAVNGEGLEGARSDPASATTDPPPPDDTPPPAPTDLAATAAGPDQIDLTWTAAVDPESGVDSYNIYRDGGLAGSTAATSFSDTGLDPSTLYSYEVSAVNGEGLEGPKSTPAEATTDPPPPDDTPPPAPTDLAATAASATRIDLTWTAAVDSESGVDSYNIYRDGAPAGSTAATSFSDTGLDPSTLYSYEVSAVNGEGLEGPTSDPASATTDPPPPDDTPPPAPTDLAATAAGPDQIDLTWTAAVDPESGVDSYNIYRDGGQVGSTSTTSFSDTSLDPSTLYSYEVSAVNGEGLEGPKSDPASATTDPDDTPPPAPSSLVATPMSASRINLSWIAAVDPESGVARYNVYRDGALVGSTSSTFFSDTGLNPATKYSYRVSAVNGDGLEGPRSGEASATTEAETDGTPPPTPSDLTASAVSTSQINLTWTAVDDSESGVTGYNVYRDGEFVSATANTTFADTELEPGTTYGYRVSAVNGAGLESNLSTVAEATTEDVPDTIPPSPPTRLRLAP